MISRSSAAALLAMAVFLFCLPAIEKAGATQIDWSGQPVSVNVTSSGVAWDSSWVVELGSFTDNFVPSSANTSQWAVKWRAASRSIYNTATRYFGGTYSYTANVSPFLTNARAYLWAFDPAATDGEWILLTNPAWKWPAGSPVTAFPVTWASSDATQAVVGQLATPGWDLKSAKIPASPLPSLTWPGWRDLHFTPAQQNDATVSGSNADYDHDGLTTFEEYLYGGSPLVAAAVPGRGVRAAFASDRLVLTLDYSQRALVSAIPEFSADLNIWSGSASDIANTAPGTITALDPAVAAGRRFARWRITASP